MFIGLSAARVGSVNAQSSEKMNAGLFKNQVDRVMAFRCR